MLDLVLVPFVMASTIGHPCACALRDQGAVVQSEDGGLFDISPFAER
jgi:hypothetical protein